MLSVSIANQQEALELDFARIKAVARAVLAGEGITDGKLTIACMTDPAIHALNKRFLEHDEPTDVITFPYSSKPLHGDLAISTDTAIAAATERGHAPPDELLLYVIHGILHLCGFDDTSDKKRAVMREREGHYLKELGIAIVHE
jgi:probable rRNA maturation factor